MVTGMWDKKVKIVVCEKTGAKMVGWGKSIN